MENPPKGTIYFSFIVTHIILKNQQTHKLMPIYPDLSEAPSHLLLQYS